MGNADGDGNQITSNDLATDKKDFYTVNLKPPQTSEKNNKKTETIQSISYFKMFKYATGLERFLLFIGVFIGIISGFIFPILIVFYGEFTTLLIDRSLPNKTTVTPTVITTMFNGGRETNGTPEDKIAATKEDAFAFGIGFLIMSVVNFLIACTYVTCLNYSALLQTAKLRRKVFESILRQDMSWYDNNTINNFPIKMIEGLDKVQEGIGEKVGVCINLSMSFLISVTIALFYGWKLTLVMLTCAPVLSVSQAIVCKVQTTMGEREMEAYSKAGSVAEEVFSSIKTVMAFNGQKKEIQRYHKELEHSKKAGIRRGYLSGLGGGVMWFITYSCYALAFWYGVSLILESRLAGNFEYTPGILLITFFGVLVGAINLGQSMPHLEAFMAARAAAAPVFTILERTSKIDPLASGGKTLSHFKGEITFKDITFSYASRAEVQVLKNVDFHVRSGEQVAIVGASGCGKSTIMQLVQRFYDPAEGQIFFDDTDIKELNVQWARQQLAIVGQEPALFATTIYENIKYGLESASEEDIESAAKLANAHDFIMKLPQGYQTVLGTRGSLISGGQKQRIAIARALIRNPKILLLDEATSALDAASERKVQEAIDKAAKGRTTLVVTHKLSTIEKSDRIIVLSEGRIVEEGTHEKLMKCKGHYFKLLELQKSNERSEDDEFTQIEEDEIPDKGTYDSTQQSTAGKKGEKENETGKEELPAVSFFQLLKYNKSEWWAILVGTLSTIVTGINVPILSVLFGELYGVLSDADANYITSTTAYYSGFLLALGIIVGIATFLQSYMMNFASVKLTSRFRKLGFAAILNQEAGWFDEENHKSGSLCAKLSGDAANIQGVTGARIGVIVQAVSTLGFALIVGLLCSWKMTLVSFLCAPLIFFGMFYEAKIIEGQSVLEKNSLEEAAGLAMECISNIRTVASLGREQYFLNKYDEILRKGEIGMKAKSKLRGAIFAVGTSSVFVGYAIALWYGGVLFADGEIHYKNVLKVSEAILFGVWVLGQTLAFAPNYLQAKMSAATLLQLIRRSPKLNDGPAVKPENWKTNGKVKFSEIDFSYPIRPHIQVLKGINLNIEEGLSIALVGPSGCGKSTVIQLLQRLYDPCGGHISLDEDDITSLKIPTLRHQMGIVSQEPVLFDRTIAENIAYGDNSREVTEAEVISAAKSANIHDFIVSLPLGYETKVGFGGGQLSGGQKQRVAIARALIKNPKILLLDEATSALDAESESVVQATLDKASTGRTTITVGHRMGAIKKANVIYRLDKGVIQQTITRNN